MLVTTQTYRHIGTDLSSWDTPRPETAPRSCCTPLSSDFVWSVSRKKSDRNWGTRILPFVSRSYSEVDTRNVYERRCTRMTDEIRMYSLIGTSDRVGIPVEGRAENTWRESPQILSTNAWGRSEVVFVFVVSVGATNKYFGKCWWCDVNEQRKQENKTIRFLSLNQVSDEGILNPTNVVVRVNNGEVLSRSQSRLDFLSVSLT